jgi:TetR/AcrR family transcriptional regulator, cholesterol catabolism regulator
MKSSSTSGGSRVSSARRRSAGPGPSTETPREARPAADADRPATGPDEAVAAALFEQEFAGAPDLARLSYAARRILAMSAALFYRRGAAGTSIRDITRACGLSPGALYNHFASKDDLLHVLVRHGHDALEDRIDAALAAAGTDPAARTAAFVRAYVMGHLVNPELAQLVRREYLHLSPERYQSVVTQRRTLRRQLSTLLAEGAAVGEFDLLDGEDGATRVAVMVLDMCSRTSEWYDRSRAESPDQLADRYVAGALRLAGQRRRRPKRIRSARAR